MTPSKGGRVGKEGSSSLDPGDTVSKAALLADRDRITLGQRKGRVNRVYPLMIVLSLSNGRNRIRISLKGPVEGIVRPRTKGIVLIIRDLERSERNLRPRGQKDLGRIKGNKGTRGTGKDPGANGTCKGRGPTGGTEESYLPLGMPCERKKGES